MLIGIISDTHDRLRLVDKAVQRLKEEKVSLVLHAGDFIAPFVIPHFKDLNVDFVGVFGNNDGEKTHLKKKFLEIGADLRGRFAEIIIDDLKIALLHGDEEELLRALINAGGHDVVVYGHTHEAKTYKIGETVVINPGEVCGYLSGKSTFATLNTETLEVKIIQLE